MVETTPTPYAHLAKRISAAALEIGHTGHLQQVDLCEIGEGLVEEKRGEEGRKGRVYEWNTANAASQRAFKSHQRHKPTTRSRQKKEKRIS